MTKGYSAVVINSDKVNFYKNFLNFLKPLHPVNKLRNKQLEVLSTLLYYRGDISSKVNDPSLIPKLLFSTDVRNRILEICGISVMNYYGIMADLKKHKIIDNNDLSKKIIPEFVDNKFTLIVSFTIEDECKD